MTKKLKDKVAIVTGASKGIGASIAKHLASEGASVVVNYSTSKEGADKVVNEIVRDGGKAVAIHANISKPLEIKQLFTDTKKAFGKLDILVNNAGIYEFTSLEDITEEAFHKLFNLNVLGLLLASQEGAKQFGSSGGSIINISSVASIATLPHSSIYSATKASVDAITKCLSKELGARKIRVNSINPGLVETEGVHTAGFLESDAGKKIKSETPLGRIGQPDDIAPAVVFLASDEASWITGQMFFITGGR
jgi:3-oxoacyl-[acyl-carrier protein] reductase